MTTASCPAGSIQGRNSNECYQIFSMPNDWAAAEEQCSNYNNGHLTSVADIFENSFIHNEIQILNYKAVEVWISGNTLFVPGSWTWSDKTSFIYTNWAPVKPRLSTSITSPPTGVCPSGYQYFSGTGYCYGYYSTQSNWSSSENYCASNGGHLASIHSYQEDNFIRNLFGPSNDPWLGLHYVNNQWIYTDGTAYDYTPANSLPNDYATNPCADMHQTGYLNNVGCNLLLERVYLFSSSYDPWIGLHYVNNQWIYTDGTAYDYSPANSLSKNYTSNPCADIHQEGYFNNVGCNEFALTSVCKVAPLSNKNLKFHA
uniref:C-type lectin domain-containing protein n=1 Tax=Acrobeloides nanus TaxID=290746 RepID=A0A914CCH8_9BILA